MIDKGAKYIVFHKNFGKIVSVRILNERLASFLMKFKAGSLVIYRIEGGNAIRVINPYKELVPKDKRDKIRAMTRAFDLELKNSD